MESLQLHGLAKMCTVIFDKEENIHTILKETNCKIGVPYSMDTFLKCSL